MTMVENELLRGERTQTVPQQNVWLTAVLVLGDNSERNHVFNELIEPTRPEFAKTSGRLCRQAMTSMIISVNCELVLYQRLGQLCIAAHVFAEPMGDLNHSTDMLRPHPLHARYGKIVSTCELESLCLSPMSSTR